MKTLFLIDGAYQAAKEAFCSILKKKSVWALITKESTKPVEKQNIDMTPISEKEAIDYYNDYTKKGLTQKERCGLRRFCYKYPDLDGCSNTINCVDTYLIDSWIRDDEKTYGFLIVRDHTCINDIIYKYEANGKLNVVPVFIYTDYSYISASNDEEIVKKWNNLLESFIWNYSDDKKVNYERVLIFNGEKDRIIPSESAINNLRTQLEELVKQVKDKNGDLVVVTESERTFIPEEIRGRKNDIEKEIGSPQQYRKNIFVMMKYHASAKDDKLYNKIKEAVESLGGYKCIRADDEYINDIFPRTDKKNKPSLVYWLATFLCGIGIAIFEKNDNGQIALNPNVAFEMGIMQQQGKHVEIFIPEISEDEKSAGNKDDANRDLFFDVRDWWKNRYCNENELIEKIKQCLPKIS